MAGIVRSAGYGVFAAGVALLAVYFWSLHLKGEDALRDALDPLTLANYRVLAALLPGAILLWLSEQIATGRHRGN